MIEPHEARVNVTYKDGVNFDLPDAVHYGATDGDVKMWVAEAIRTGSVPGVEADPNVDLQLYAIERHERPLHPVPGQRDHNLIMLRPKTAYG